MACLFAYRNGWMGSIREYDKNNQTVSWVRRKGHEE